jgi:ribosome-binding protein aMBF1 (putative translation factor)
VEPAQKPLQAARASNGADAAPAPRPAPASGEEAARREEWEQLRVTVREQRTERGLTVAQLAEAIGASATTVKTALGMRRPPSQRLRQRLEAWVSAPEVAAEPAAPFRAGRTGNGRTRSNGAGNHAGAAAA